jgi:hypothetical protein
VESVPVDQIATLQLSRKHLLAPSLRVGRKQTSMQFAIMHFCQQHQQPLVLLLIHLLLSWLITLAALRRSPPSLVR